MKVNKVLLLDDDPDTISLYKIRIQKMGYDDDRFTYFYSPLKALAYLEKTVDFPDIMLVDINMDVMNGFEFVEHFEKKYYNHHPDTRVLILSSSVRDADKSKALSYRSVEDFITKPISKSRLKSFFNGEGQPRDPVSIRKSL